MKLPYIILVDDDPQVLGAIQRDMRNKYRQDYRVVATESANEALEIIKELKLKNDAVALIISDQRMPEMDGMTFLQKSKEIYDEVKQVLLTAYSDIDAAIKGINNVRIDYYLLKPWNPPEEKLFPVIDDLLEEWHAHYKPDHEGIRIIGYQWSPKSHAVKEFLSGNLIPYQWLDAENDVECQKYLTSTNQTLSNLPLVILKDGKFLCDPSINELASSAGLKQIPAEKMYDVLIIGAGPAGLAASVYGSCEGLKTLLIEKNAPGGQASSSARIENYLGFPSGLSGAELTRRAMAQTTRFGTEFLAPQNVKKISLQDGYKIVELSDGSVVHSKAIIISTGVNYNKLDVPDIEKFTGSGVYYGSAAVEAHACRDQSIYIVGGGNSACQAALHLAKFAKDVYILIRKDKLKDTAAHYLVENIAAVRNIHVLGNTELKAVKGESSLEEIVLVNSNTGEENTVPAKAVFIYIGAKPGTAWLQGTLLTDDKQFIVTGRELMNEKSFHTIWKLKREPYLSESSVPGIFASGDVRHGALAGISSAVGEGALAIRFVRKYLQEN
jgi:thioredoxin reductase (NADPH)